MKKALVLLLALSLIGGLMFADGGVTVSGNVQAQWGFDWDYATSGFKGVVDGVQLKFTLPIEKSELKATGDEGSTSYGEISVGNIRIYTESAYGIGNYGSSALNLKWDELKAKLVMGNLSIVFMGGASTDINYVGNKTDSFWLTNAFDYYVYSGKYGANDSAQSAAKANSWESWNQIQFDVPGDWSMNFPMNYGVVVNYTVPSMVNLSVDVASYKAWDSTDAVQTTAAATSTTTTIYWDFSAGVVATTTDATTIDVAGGDIILSSSTATTAAATKDRFAFGDQGDNAYVGRISADLKAVPNLTAKAGASVGYVNPGYATGEIGMDFGGRVGYDVVVSDTIKVTPGAAVDVKTQKNYLGLFTAGGVTASVMGAKVVANAGFSSVDTTTNVAWPLTNPAFAATVTADAGSLVPNLTAKAAFEWVDPLWNNTMDETYAIFAQLGYGIAVNEAVKVTPWLKVSYDNKDDTTLAAKKITSTAGDNDDNDLYAKLGVDVTGLLKNTTFTVKWDSNDLMQENVYNPLKMGQIVFLSKVSF